MAEELELSEYSTIHGLEEKKVKTETSSINSAQSGKSMREMQTKKETVAILK